MRRLRPSADNRCGNGRRGFRAGRARLLRTSLAVAVMLRSEGSGAPARSTRAIVSSAVSRPVALAFETDMFRHRVAQHMRAAGSRRNGSVRAASRVQAPSRQGRARPRRRARRTPAPRAANWRRAGWRHEGRSRRIRRRPTDPRARRGHKRPPQCRPCGSAQRVRPGSASLRDRSRLRDRPHRRLGSARRIPHRWLPGNRGRYDGLARSRDEAARATISRGARSASG